MKDAFGNTLTLGTQIIYTPNSRWTEYHIGEIIDMYPATKSVSNSVRAIDRVKVKITKSSKTSIGTRSADPIIYASNVVKFK